MAYDFSIDDVLARLRAARNIERLAELCGLSSRTLIYLRTGGRSPTLKTLTAIAAGLDALDREHADGSESGAGLTTAEDAGNSAQRNANAHNVAEVSPHSTVDASVRTPRSRAA